MNPKTKRKKQAKVLRIFRKIHRLMGAFLFFFFFFISVSGLLLGWKKNSAGVLLAETQIGSSSEFSEWLPLGVLYEKAARVIKDSVAKNTPLALDRVDIRKDKGVIKFIYEDYYGLQLDGATGQLLEFGKRQSDFVENIHDGSVLDIYFNTSGSPIKILYTTVMSIALLFFTITGFWLWYGPKRMRKSA
ncbi:PepSY domain-containing protein [Cellulophaga baltica]|uniref:PepSY domain-containing protein n=1 Tax=Cellulophaga baltica TaxID=76594 RepID=UPI00040F64F0|nr:PepSY domain-containing protein [Cellulophaga baltica]AIY11818.1 DNA mismatch repair protein [Cellulophaga baltica NN016038]